MFSWLNLLILCLYKSYKFTLSSAVNTLSDFSILIDFDSSFIFSQNNHVRSMKTRWENRKFRITSSVHPYVFARLRPQTTKLWILLYLHLSIYSVAQVWCSVNCRELYTSFSRLAIHFSHGEHGQSRTRYVCWGMNMKMKLSWDKMSKRCRGCGLIWYYYFRMLLIYYLNLNILFLWWLHHYYNDLLEDFGLMNLIFEYYNY